MKNILILAISLSANIFCVNVVAQAPKSEIIESTTHCEIKNNRLRENISHLIQINDRTGEDDAQIALFYAKGEKLKIKNAQIEDVNGNIIRKLKNNEVTDQNAVINSSTLYSDYFVKHFKLIHNNYPYRIRYEYEYETARFFTINSLNYARSETPVRKETITVDIPTDYSIIYKQRNIDAPSIETLDAENKKRYRWEFSYDANDQIDINTNFNKVEAPFLKIVPLNFKYGVEGSNADWKEFGNWIFNLNKTKNDLPLSEQQKVDQLIKGKTDIYEKIRILYNYMQDNTRYINVSLKVGGLQTYPASYVCINKYGDCKALSNYMVSILKHAGVDSYYTLVHSDKFRKDIDPDFASQDFNHVIVTVPLKNDTMFLECTSKNIACGYIPTSIQGRKALLIDENKSHLVDIPAMQTEMIQTSRTIDLNLSGTMMINVAIKNQLKGYLYELYGHVKDSFDKNSADKFLRNNIMSGSFSLDKYTIENTDRNDASIDMYAQLKMDHLYKIYGNNLSIVPFSWNLPHYETPENRVCDVLINYPTNMSDTIRYELNTISIKKLPENILFESPFGYYSQTFQQEENKLIIHKILKIYSGKYSLEEYPMFYDFMREVSNNELKNIYIETL